MSEILKDVAAYVDNVVAVCQDPSNLTRAEELSEHEKEVTARLALSPVNVWRPQLGFQGCDTSDDYYGVNSVRAMVTDGYTDREPLPLERQSRGAFIGLGAKAPVSGNLEQADFPEFYDILRAGCSRLVAKPAFTKFMFRRIRANLGNEAFQIYSGYNMNPLPKNEALDNVETALSIIGYPYSVAGKVVLESCKVLDRIAPSQNRWVRHE